MVTVLVLLLVFVVCVGVGVGCGSAFPIVGTSPASAGTKRATTRIAAIASRFIDLTSVWRCQSFYIAGTKTEGKNPCKAMALSTTIRSQFHFSSQTHTKGLSNAGDIGEAGFL